MYQQVYYVDISNGGVTASISAALLTEAAIMLHDKQKKKKVQRDTFAALITTKFETALLGSLAGILFKATIDREERVETRVHFLVREQELREIAADRLDPLLDCDTHSRDVSVSEVSKMARALEYPMPGTYN